MIWVLVTCWLTGVRALLNSSCPQMLDFCLWFGCRYTWNTAEDHCQILLWGFASGAAFNLYLRVKEEAGQWEAVLRHPAPDGCLEEKHQEPIRVSRTLLSSPLPQAPGCALSLASPTGMGGAPVKGMLLTFPAGRQTWMSGSALVHTLCSLKRSKHIYFWHKTWYRFLWLCVSRA